MFGAMENSAVKRFAEWARFVWAGLHDYASPQPDTFSPPSNLRERERLRRGRLLSAFVIISLALDLGLIFGFLSHGPQIPYPYGLAAGIALQALSVIPNRMGRIELACFLYLSSTLTSAVIALLLTPFEVVYAGVILYRFYATAVIQAGFLVHRRAPVAVAAMTILLIAAHMNVNRGYYSSLPLFGTVSVVSLVAFTTVLMITLALLTSLVAAGYDAALSQADRTEEVERVYNDLRESHRSLEASNREVRAQADKLAALNAELRIVQEELQLSHKKLEELNRSLEEQAATDPMTKLPNFRVFSETLEREVAQAIRNGLPLSLLMLDVDHFKEFNDRHGHLAGDEALKQIGDLLRANVRGGDLAARYGGEEFAIIMPYTPMAAANMAAERIRSSVNKLKTAKGPLTVSIGVACLSLHARDQEALVREADAALYSAKFNGRNCVVSAPMVRLDVSLPAYARAAEPV